MTTDRRDRDRATASPQSDEYAAHLERGRAVWDRWSDHYTLSERDFEPMREAAIDRLALEEGDRVLEIGCGPGVNVDRIRGEIGDSGQLVAVDYSPEMVASARERIDAQGWENVDVLQADAAAIEFDEPFDAALATLSLSVVPDAHRVASTVSDSLAPGATFVVFDLRTVPNGPARILNPLLWRVLYWIANWNPDGDVVDALADVFDDCAVVDTYLAGTAYTAVCTKRDVP